MNLEKIKLAKEMAQEFVRRCDAAERVLAGDQGGLRRITGCKETASLRRQSSELSGALVVLRKP